MFSSSVRGSGVGGSELSTAWAGLSSFVMSRIVARRKRRAHHQTFVLGCARRSESSNDRFSARRYERGGFCAAGLGAGVGVAAGFAGGAVPPTGVVGVVVAPPVPFVPSVAVVVGAGGAGSWPGS